MNKARTITLLGLASFIGACTAKDSVPADTAAAAITPVPSSNEAPSTEPTANEISNYKLDMDKMRKYAEAIKGFQNLSAADSAAAEAVASQSNQSTRQMIARIESTPVAMRVLRNAGLSAKDYVWITAAWLQAAMTEAVLASSKDAKMPEGQNPQNVEFIRQHRAVLETMMGPMKDGN